ncbi:MAG: ribosomal protein methylthiotransferase, partial [Microvirga sp.]|nr:ribosomal protein methylthiotransferase [Microvirga sp.]
ERIHNWREICPDLAIRSTFIVGFPGETEEDMDLLVQWLKDAKIDRAGCFQYEPVQGAPANNIAGAVPDEVKEERWHRFMQTQQEVSTKVLKSKVGKTLPVIIDEPGATVATGRTKYDAPEIDGAVYVASRQPLKAGEIVNVKVESSDEYDLHGTVV